jgi:hypothetical protein
MHIYLWNILLNGVLGNQNWERILGVGYLILDTVCSDVVWICEELSNHDTSG